MIVQTIAIVWSLDKKIVVGSKMAGFKLLLNVNLNCLCVFFRKTALVYFFKFSKCREGLLARLLGNKIGSNQF